MKRYPEQDHLRGPCPQGYVAGQWVVATTEVACARVVAGAVGVLLQHHPTFDPGSTYKGDDYPWLVLWVYPDPLNDQPYTIDEWWVDYREFVLLSDDKPDSPEAVRAIAWYALIGQREWE